MAHEYWLSDEDWAVLEPPIPIKRLGVKPGNNRRQGSDKITRSSMPTRW
jgi:hypothetical protein